MIKIREIVSAARSALEGELREHIHDTEERNEKCENIAEMFVGRYNDAQMMQLARQSKFLKDRKKTDPMVAVEELARHKLFEYLVNELKHHSNDRRRGEVVLRLNVTINSINIEAFESPVIEPEYTIPTIQTRVNTPHSTPYQS